MNEESLKKFYFSLDILNVEDYFPSFILMLFIADTLKWIIKKFGNCESDFAVVDQ